MLSIDQIDALKIPYIQDMLTSDKLRMEQISQITNRYKVDALKIPYIQDMLTSDKLRMEQILQITGIAQVDALKIPYIQDLLTSDKLRMEQILQITDIAQIDALEIPCIQDLLTSDKLRMEQILQITHNSQVEALEIPCIQDLLTSDKLRMEQILQITDYAQVHALNIPYIQEMIQRDELNMEQILQITHDSQAEALEIPYIQAMLTRETLIMDQILQITDYAQVHALNIPYIQERFEGREINMDQILSVNTTNKYNALNNRFVQALLQAQIVNFEQALQFSPEALEALNDENTIARLIAGELHVEAFLNNNFLPNINDRQSTHTASVHQSASLSAKNLYDLYKKQIKDVHELNAVTASIKKYLDTLDDTDQNKAAKRFIEKIIQENSPYEYIDKSSNISIKQLVALTFLASQDKKNLFEGVDTKDALSQFVQGLFEIQRGYNLNILGKDPNPTIPDHPICLAGTFNKLIEKLTGLHQSVEMVFINQQTAALKFPKLVEEEALNYLTNYQTRCSKPEFNALIQKIEKEGIEVILTEIEPTISDKFFEEFKSIFGEDGKENPFFKENMDNITYIDLSKIIDRLKATTNSNDATCSKRMSL